MDITTVLAVIGFGLGVLITPIYVYLLVKGVRSLSDIRDFFRRPPGDRGVRREHDAPTVTDPGR